MFGVSQQHQVFDVAGNGLTLGVMQATQGNGSQRDSQELKEAEITGAFICTFMQWSNGACKHQGADYVRELSSGVPAFIALPLLTPRASSACKYHSKISVTATTCRTSIVV